MEMAITERFRGVEHEDFLGYFYQEVRTRIKAAQGGVFLQKGLEHGVSNSVKDLIARHNQEAPANNTGVKLAKAARHRPGAYLGANSPELKSAKSVDQLDNRTEIFQLVEAVEFSPTDQDLPIQAVHLSEAFGISFSRPKATDPVWP